MNISNFDQNKKDSITFEGEAVRLSNEFRSKPARTFLNMYGHRVDIPAKRGFDIETCNFLTMANYLADSRIYKSESQIMLLHRIMSVRFPNEYTQNKSKIENIGFDDMFSPKGDDIKGRVSTRGDEVSMENVIRGG